MEEGQQRARFFKLKYVVIIIFICIIVPFAAVGLSDLYRNILEHNLPAIDLIEVPRGIGLSPVSVKFRVSDLGAGLDEVVVRLRQKGPARELKRLTLEGAKSEEITVDFSSEDNYLNEGTAVINVRAFDRSFWNNSAEMTLPIRVDFRRPKIEPLSPQNNARQGGSQLVFYKAIDEDLALSGVKVGSKIFLGTPATGIDKDLNEKNLHAAIYAVDRMQEEITQADIRLFAEDKVGNAVSARFYNKVLERRFRTVTVTLDHDFMRDKVSELAAKVRGREELPRGEERALAEFKLVNEKLRLLNETEVGSLTAKSPRLESFFHEPFIRQSVTVQQAFGDKVVYMYEGQELGSAISTGEELRLPRGTNEVLAVNSGIVIFAQDIGIYGWTVGVDHGLGLVSIYSRLSKAAVPAGATVERGEVVGTAGRTGFARNEQVFFEMRVQGVPVDPREWLDSAWFYAHILGKINEVKKILGIPIYHPLR